MTWLWLLAVVVAALGAQAAYRVGFRSARFCALRHIDSVLFSIDDRDERRHLLRVHQSIRQMEP